MLAKLWKWCRCRYRADRERSPIFLFENRGNGKRASPNFGRLVSGTWVEYLLARAIIVEVAIVKNLGVFEKTQQKTARWIAAVAHNMGSTDLERSYHVLRSVLHAVRDRLPTDEAVQLAAQMPMLVRGFYYEGWHRANRPERFRHKQEFLDHIARDVPGLDPAQRERAASAVFSMLNQEISGSEAEQVRHALPSEIRDLWDTSART